MARRRKIKRNPRLPNFYLLDANFLANKFIPYARVTNARERTRVERSQDWWVEIDKQLERGDGVAYIPDICIAEAFKVLAKKYYENRYFRNTAEYKFARDRLIRFIHLPPKVLKASTRRISVHDLSTSRDIIIAVDRFFEVFFRHKLPVSVIDLLILATAKYLIDFFKISPKHLHIITLDNSLWRGSRHLADVPSAFNPNDDSNLAAKIFV
ncbi:MAG: hypothetical protein L0Z46_09515 [Nitrospiraceae bacterium]|nr:hypothetical protein [Nitrospiraceae bacterium]